MVLKTAVSSDLKGFQKVVHLPAWCVTRDIVYSSTLVESPDSSLPEHVPDWCAESSAFRLGSHQFQNLFGTFLVVVCVTQLA